MLRSEERMILLQKNLDNAEMFAYIHVFNQPTWQEELEFLFGTENKETWKYYNTELTGEIRKDFLKNEYNFLRSSPVHYDHMYAHF